MASEDLPGWTGSKSDDPGVALLELFAYVMDQLSFRQDAIADSNRLQLGAERPSKTRGDRNRRVVVDGEAWVEVPTLESAGRTDRVYSVHGDRISFGDGTHGMLPSAGSTVLAAYRCGSGASANMNIFVRFRWPPTRSRCRIIVDQRGKLLISRF